jgi:TolB protein
MRIIGPILLLINLATYAQVKNCGLLYQLPGKESAYPHLSKNGKNILYQSNQTGKWQLMIMDTEKGEHRNLSNDTLNNYFPDWSPDNKLIAFSSDRDGNENIFLMSSDGSGLKKIIDDKARDIHPYFSPDGKYILFSSSRGNGSLDIYRYEINSGKTLRITDTPEDETCARYSPDMKRIVYLKNGVDTDDIFSLDLSNFLSENITNTNRTRDGWPCYSPDGKWIYYSSMETGIYNIYRIKPDGSGKEQITKAKTGEEDARTNIAFDNQSLIYNKRIGTTIQILKCDLGRKETEVTY